MRRAHERYSELGDPEKLVRTVRRLIRGGDSVLLARKSKRVSYHVTAVEGYVVVAVYDHHRNQVVTLLPSRNLYNFTVDSVVAVRVRAKLEGARFANGGCRGK